MQDINAQTNILNQHDLRELIHMQEIQTVDNAQVVSHVLQHQLSLWHVHQDLIRLMVLHHALNAQLEHIVLLMP